VHVCADNRQLSVQQCAFNIDRRMLPDDYTWRAALILRDYTSALADNTCHSLEGSVGHYALAHQILLKLIQLFLRSR